MEILNTPSRLFNTLKVGNHVIECVVWFEDVDGFVPCDLQVIVYSILDFPNEKGKKFTVEDINAASSYRFTVTQAYCRNTMLLMEHAFHVSDNDECVKMLSENSFYEYKHGVFRLFTVL